MFKRSSRKMELVWWNQRNANLLAAACTLFTGATYIDIDDWAALLNLQIPKKTSFYAIQSSYLIPVVEIVYKEKQEQMLEGLWMQNILQKGVHLSGDGRSDRYV